MLQRSNLKENIDGEALLWAYSRLAKRKMQKSAIIVISDGAPVDDATLSENRGTFLEEHLRFVIKHIEQQPGFSVLGIGDILVDVPTSMV